MATKNIVIDARIRRSSSGRYTDRLLDHLQALDKENKYTVLVEPSDEWQPKERNFKALACKYKRFSLNPFKQIGFSRFLHKLNADLVHFSMTGHQPLFYFGKQVTTTHDLTMYKFARPGRLPKWLHRLRMLGYRLLMWQAHRKAERVIVPSEYVRDALAKYHLFTNRKITVTYEASEPMLPGKAVAPEAIPEKFILYVGSCFPHKNMRRLVQAMDLVNTKYPGVKLVHAGKMDLYAKRLRRWVKNQGKEGVVSFLGFVSDEELKWLYQNAEAYVFPSLSEGFGLPGLEAMVHGCPVVSSNATCLPEVYGDAAEYFDPLNVEEMAGAINKVLSSPARRSQLIALGKKQAGKYSWQKMAQETLEVYKEVLEK